MKKELFGHTVAVFCIALLLWTNAVQLAQAQEQPSANPTKLSEVPDRGSKQLTIEKDPVKQSWMAVIKDDAGVSRISIVKDPNSPDVLNSRQKGLSWTELTELGHSPWGKPAKSIQEIAADPNVRRYIREKTTLSAEQQVALNRGLGKPEKWIKIKAGELPILEAFWGGSWQKYKVSMELTKKFKDTSVFLYFAPETGDWFAFYAYCRNLGQPFSSFSWVANVEEKKVVPETAVEVKPQVQPPSCISLKRTDNPALSLQVGQKAEFQATFYNPSGVDFSLRFLLVNKTTGERTSISGFAASATVTADKPGQYQVLVEGQYEGKDIEASACKLDVSFFAPQPPVQQTVSKPEPKGHGKLIAGIVGAGAVAGAIIFATRVKNPSSPATTPSKPPCSSPSCQQPGPANRPGLVFRF